MPIGSFQECKIGGDDAIFVRCAVAESGAYLAYVSIYAARKVQKERIGTILRIRSNKFTNKIKKKKTVWEERLSIAKRER